MKNINRRIITGQISIALTVLLSLVLWRMFLPNSKPAEIAKALPIASDKTASMSSVLKCRFSVPDNDSQKRGELLVDDEQWEAIKEILLTHDIEKIKPLISIKKILRWKLFIG